MFVEKLIIANHILKMIKSLNDFFKDRDLVGQREQLMIKALCSIQTASIATRNFISNNGYEPNVDLAKLWLEAFEYTTIARIEDLPVYLYNKARFWGQPDEWLNNKITLELVPKLSEIEEECNNILHNLTNR